MCAGHKGQCCTAKWQAGRKCHCCLCGENFSTVGNFDKHQDRRGDKIVCLDPTTLDMTQNKYGVWVQAGETDWDERFKRT